MAISSRRCRVRIRTLFISSTSIRWMQAGDRCRSSNQSKEEKSAHEWNLVRRMFDYLEANAGEYWEVPSLDRISQNGHHEPEDLRNPQQHEEEASWNQDDEDDKFGAAYEEMTYKDTTDDGVDSSTFESGNGSSPEVDDFIELAEHISKRLRFSR